MSDRPRPPGYRAMHLDAMDSVPWAEGRMTWVAVRGQLGINAFGAAAFTARAAGEQVVEPHTESEGRDHEELYFVARGRATFTLDGVKVDAPAVMFVFVEDPAVHRSAVAGGRGPTRLWRIRGEWSPKDAMPAGVLAAALAPTARARQAHVNASRRPPRTCSRATSSNRSATRPASAGQA